MGWLIKVAPPYGEALHNNTLDTSTKKYNAFIRQKPVMAVNS